MLRVEEGASGVRLLTLDRPEKLNAMTGALYRACADALADAATSESVGAVVLTGAGRAFCAGADMSLLTRDDADTDTDTDTGTAAGPAFDAFVEALATFPKLLVAAVNGVAVGIGMTLLAHCDVVVIAESARLRAPFVPLGVAPEAGSSVTFAALMGWQRAATVLLTGRWIAAAEAVDLGLAAEVTADGDAIERAIALARAVVTAGPLASIVATKTLLVEARRAAVAAASARERDAYGSLYAACVPGGASTFL